MNDAISFAINIPDLGFIGAVSWFLWNRYQSLERRLDGIDLQIIQGKNVADLAKSTYESDKQMLEYRINGNHELIKHKAGRLENGLLQVSASLDKISECQLQSSRTMRYLSYCPTGSLS